MPNTITVAQAKAKFLESVGHQSSTKTIQAYRNALEAFLTMLTGQQIDVLTFPAAELGENSITDYVHYTKRLSPATESLYLQVIKNFFEFLDAENLSIINVSRVRMLMRRRTRRSGAQPLEYPEAEIKHVIETMQLIAETKEDGTQLESIVLRDKRDSAIILTLADTGLRVEEVCQLKIGDIDWANNHAILHGRGSKQSFVRFSTRAIRALKNYLDFRSCSDLKTDHWIAALPLFARHDKGAGKKIKPVTPTTIRNIVSDRAKRILGEEAAVTITPHTFLHYFVTTILRATGNLKLAQVLARHTNIQITQRYAHLSDDELDKGYYEIFEKNRHNSNDL